MDTALIINKCNEDSFESFLDTADYPNPSRGMATIAYSLQTPGTVRLQVYDLMGRRVATPLNEYRMPGEYEHSFNTDGLESGIYICDFSSVTERVTSKLIVEH